MSGFFEFVFGVFGLMVAALFFGVNLFTPAASLGGWLAGGW